MVLANFHCIWTALAALLIFSKKTVFSENHRFHRFCSKSGLKFYNFSQIRKFFFFITIPSKAMISVILGIFGLILAKKSAQN